jgi:hypothetical protein
LTPIAATRTLFKYSICSILWDAHSKRKKKNPNCIEDFIRAYVFQGTVKKEKEGIRAMDENIYARKFWYMHLASKRSASKLRDYIFATMPQFPWYHYPSDAENMSFETIFVDFYEQACSAGHQFSCLITRSMIDANVCDPEDAWKPGLS